MMWVNILFMLLTIGIGILLLAAIDRLNKVLTAFSPVWSFVKMYMEGVNTNESKSSGDPETGFCTERQK